MRVLELFSGIGGCAAAVDGLAEVVAAVDQHPRAIGVYRATFGHPVLQKNILGLRPGALPDADLWWMSPPCQPYTVRGAQRDLEDNRARSLVHVLGLVDAARPPFVALENVPGFDGSRAHELVRRTLTDAGYAIDERLLCPTALGVPGQRRRFYLVAGRDGLLPRPAPRPTPRPLAGYLGTGDPALDVEPALRERFVHALHVVDRDDPRAVAACFTSAYGRSPVYAGSYLRDGDRLRRFSPSEIAALLGFPPSLDLSGLSLRHGWDLVGNSLSVDAVREVLRVVPGLDG